MTDTRQPDLFRSQSPRRPRAFDGDAFGAGRSGATPLDSNTFNARVAELFKGCPNEWIDGISIAEIAGLYGWRTRVSEVRRHYNMIIENRQFKRGRVTVSEYRFLPAVTKEHDDAA